MEQRLADGIGAPKQDYGPSQSPASFPDKCSASFRRNGNGEDNSTLPSALHFLSVFGGRRSAHLFEREEECIHTRIATEPGDRFDLIVRLGQQRLRIFDSDSADVF